MVGIVCLEIKPKEEIKMLKFLKNFWNDEKGQSMSEYGLILALVAVVAIATLTVLGTNIMEMFQNIADSIAQ